MHSAVGSSQRHGPGHGPGPGYGKGPSSAPGVGRGVCGGHHGELLQGSFRCAERGLITLPVRGISSSAYFTPGRTSGLTPNSTPGTVGEVVTVVPEQKAKARSAARRTLLALGRADLGGMLEIRSSVPVGKGFGSSSCDIVATVRAVCHALRREPSPSLIAAIATATETASDPLMYSGSSGSTVLFAQREGRVARTLPGLPPLWVLSCDSAPPDGCVVTELMPLPQYSPEERRSFEDLLSDMVRALEDRDADLVGQVATASAVINGRYLPNPLLAPAREVSGSCGALGVQVAHSGTLVGLLFADTPDVRRRAAGAVRLLRPFGARRCRLYRVC